MKFRISAWAIRNPIPVAILFIALTLSGMIAYTHLPIKQNPNVVLPLVMVNVTQSGAAASQMETQVTRPIEDALASLTNVKHITSRVNLGSSTTTIEFELGTDMQKVTDDVRTAVDRTRVILPPGIDPPNVQRIDLDSQAILTYVVQVPSMSPVALSWFVDDTVARALQAEPGVAPVNRLGGADREINVTLDPARMAAFGVTAPQVNTALYAFNVNESGGRSQIGEQEQTVRVLGEAATVDTLRRLMVPTAGRYVTLADNADVRDGQGETRGFARLDNTPVVGFEVQKTTNASDVDVEARVKAGVLALQKASPGVKFNLIQSSVENTRESFTATTHVLVEGMVLAAFVVFLFLKSWRATAIAAVAMPLSLIPTFSVIHLLGFNLDQITLLSLTLVIGILVDDAIVEIENIEKRIERGETPYRAAVIGADSIGLAVIATTATIVAVFTPVSFMPGIAGEFFREFGLTVSTAVLFSLVVARLLTPLLAAYFLKPRLHTTPAKPLGGLYRSVLDWSLNHRWVSIGIGGMIFIGSLVMMATRPVGFEPAGNPDFLSLSLEGPPGATRAFMENAVAELTQGLRRQAEDAQVFAQVGTANDPGNTADLRNGSVLVILKRDRVDRFGEIRKLIRPLLRQIPDVRISSQGDQGSFDFEIVLTGQDSAVLDRTQFALEQQMAALPGVSDIHPAPPPARGLIPFWVEALLYTVMPLFHLFAFVFLSVLLGWWFVAYLARPALRWHLLALVALAFLPAFYQVRLMTGNFPSWTSSGSGR